MTAFESSDPRWLSRADERSLELTRYERVLNCDDRREAVIDELLRRGTEVIATEATRSGQAQGLSAQQILTANEEAAATLAMRLRTPVPLKAVTPLARDLIAAAIAARTPKPKRPPQLVSRAPELDQVSEGRPPAPTSRRSAPSAASIAARTRDAARRGQIRPNDPQSS